MSEGSQGCFGDIEAAVAGWAFHEADGGKRGTEGKKRWVLQSQSLMSGNVLYMRFS